MKEKLFVLSMDAMVHEDVAYLLHKPNFSRLMAQRAEVERVRTIYPSITYPAHTSILTGCRPGRHGVISNTSFKTVNDGIDHWHLYAGAVRAENLFAAAKRAGCTTAAVYWPVTGLDPHIDWLINEYFFPDPDEPVPEGFARFGASEDTLDVIRENMDRYPLCHAKSEPLKLSSTFDNFINSCACSLIRRFQPDLLMVHNCFMDSARHRYGVFHEETMACLDQMDLWLGELMEAMADAGVYDQTNFVILSDHGQLNFARRIKLNVLLARGGYIDVLLDGSVRGWLAFAQSNGMSGTIYLRDPHDRRLWQEVYSYLRQLAADGVWGFQDVFTAEEVRQRYGTYGSFSFMVESDGYTAFGDGWTEPLLSPIDFSDYRLGRAAHGYQPEKGPQPVFLGRGPAFRPGAILPSAQIIDEAPTLAAILGQEMPQAEGRCLRELLT